MTNDKHEDRVGAENYILVGVCFVLGLIAIGAGSLFAYRHFVPRPPAPQAAVPPAGGGGVGLPGAGLPAVAVAGNNNPPPPAAAPAAGGRNRRRAGNEYPPLLQGWSLNQAEYGFVTAWPIFVQVFNPQQVPRCSLLDHTVVTGNASVAFLVRKGDYKYGLTYADFEEAPANPGEFIDLNMPPLHRAALQRLMGEAPLPQHTWVKDNFIHDDSRYTIGPTRAGFKVYAEACVVGRRLYLLHVEAPENTQDQFPTISAFFDNFRIP